MSSAPIMRLCNGTMIGSGHAPFIVAEMSANHLGDLERALAIVDAAADAGADAIKLQTLTPEGITLDSDRPEFTIEGGPWNGERLIDLYRRAQTPWDWHKALFDRAASRGILAFSAPFEDGAVELLESLNCPIYKIASFEIVDHGLIARAAATGKPLIMSTGMASDAEVSDAVDVARSAGATEIALLHCISGYPTPPEAFNLRRMARLAAHQTQVGLSDHSHGVTVSSAAVALGATIIEKHLTLSRDDGGPDAGFSMEPHEFSQLVHSCKTTYAALGNGSQARPECESGSRRFRRSLYAVADIPAGAKLTRDNVRSLRPDKGLPPKHLPEVIGREARHNIERGTPLAWSLFQ